MSDKKKPNEELERFYERYSRFLSGDLSYDQLHSTKPASQEKTPSTHGQEKKSAKK